MTEHLTFHIATSSAYSSFYKILFLISFPIVVAHVEDAYEVEGEWVPKLEGILLASKQFLL